MVVSDSQKKALILSIAQFACDYIIMLPAFHNASWTKTSRSIRTKTPQQQLSLSNSCQD